jgi:hypothetical protein
LPGTIASPEGRRATPEILDLHGRDVGKRASSDFNSML